MIMHLQLDSKISYIVFLHDYLLACNISTIRTLVLNILYITGTLIADAYISQKYEKKCSYFEQSKDTSSIKHTNDNYEIHVHVPVNYLLAV